MMAVTRIFVMCSKGIASGARIQEVLDTPEDLAVHPEEPEDSPIMWYSTTSPSPTTRTNPVWRTSPSA